MATPTLKGGVFWSPVMDMTYNVGHDRIHFNKINN